MDDLSITIRHCKRSKSIKLDLSGRGINIVPQEIYQLTDLEVLDLSNNKITSIDSKISNLTKLTFLNVSNNQIISLPQSIAKLSNLEVFNASGNPLGSQFEVLLKKENQSGPKLSSALKTAFGQGGLSSGFGDDFPSFQSSQGLQLPGQDRGGFGLTKGGFGLSDQGGFGSPDKGFDSSDRTFGSRAGSTRPTWLEDKSGTETKGFGSDKSEDLGLKRQLSETESILAREQQRVIELKKEIETLKQNQQESNKLGFSAKSSRNDFGLQEEIAQLLEINYNELEASQGLSQGGFSIVQKGIYRGTPVAIKKIFNPNITEELLADISNEVDMLNKLRHPNIVLLMGICSKPPNLCIVTELLPNGSLFTLLHMSKVELDSDQRLSIAKDIALAINYLHLSSIVHRDIKSHNVLIDEKFKVKLCDFGLARYKNALNKGAMQFSGTPCYMAPELFQKRAYDEKIDVFAFGTLLWELFSKKVPYEGLEPADVMAKVIREDPLSMIGVPKKISQLVTECRATDAKKRPDSTYILNVLNSITSL